MYALKVFTSNKCKTRIIASREIFDFTTVNVLTAEVIHGLVKQYGLRYIIFIEEMEMYGKKFSSKKIVISLALLDYYFG